MHPLSKISPLLLMSCTELSTGKTINPEDTAAETETDSTDSSGNDTDNPTDTATPDTPQRWRAFSHPCLASRTDAMWFDDQNKGYVGCGSGADGKGLYQTIDGGQNWSLVTDPFNVLEEMRVSSIQRSYDNHLYLAGTAPNGLRVVYIDGGNTLQEFYRRPDTSPQSWQTYHVGTFRKSVDGRAVSESLTGSDVIYWSSADPASYVSGYGWWSETVIGTDGAQILDLETYDGKYFGVGSTISQPPYFYYEASDGMGSDFSLQALKLSPEGLGDFSGEVYDIAIDSQGDMLLSGVNQTAGRGTIWYNNGSYDDRGSWTFVDLIPLLPEGSSTRFYGGCREANLLVAVGDYSQSADALIVYSTDSGNSWNIMEPEAGPLSQCQIVASKVYITGGDGLFAIFDPSISD